MGQLYEYAKMAIMNIFANKTRSLLTMLGIIIGIGSVIMVLSIGGGGQKMIDEQLSGFDTGGVYLYVTSGNKSDYITKEDIDAIRTQVKGLKGVSPELYFNGTAQGTRESIQASVNSGNSDWLYTNTDKIKYGRYWNEQDEAGARKVIVIDSAGAKAMFGSDNVVGMTMQLTLDGRTADYTIIGVMKSNSSYSGTKKSVRTSIPLSTISRHTDSADSYYGQISISALEKTEAAKVADRAMQLLQQRHGNAKAEAYFVYDISADAANVRQVTSMFTGVIAAVAAISLLVGGIGVMNIMLVSVTERTREIGIRKSLGAKTKTILLQFLIEAGTLTLVGGLIGILLGLMGGNGVGKIMNMNTYVPFTTVLSIAGFSCAIGIFFGIYPARKAAKLNPIEALRQN
ncbi:MAG: ABC transporter permease [Oscillospiraceae bacterium]|nr:ABC transporter permease [Oscillospiraceae bacterium]